jgi:hypothetical protein
MDALQSLATAMFWNPAEAKAAEEMLRNSLAIAKELDDRNGMAQANVGLGRVRALAVGDPGGALRILETGLKLFQETGNRMGVAEHWWRSATRPAVSASWRRPEAITFECWT